MSDNRVAKRMLDYLDRIAPDVWCTEERIREQADWPEGDFHRVAIALRDAGLIEISRLAGDSLEPIYRAIRLPSSPPADNERTQP